MTRDNCGQIKHRYCQLRDDILAPLFPQKNQESGRGNSWKVKQSIFLTDGETFVGKNYSAM